MKTEDAMNLPIVNLTEATEPYQPVTGSSVGSVYHAVAIGPDVNVAVRLKTNGQLSIRVAGNNLSKCASALKKAGFSESASHFSVHLGATSQELQLKALGALLLSLGIKFTKIASRPAQLVGKGS